MYLNSYRSRYFLVLFCGCVFNPITVCSLYQRLGFIHELMYVFIIQESLLNNYHRPAIKVRLHTQR